MAFTIIYQPSAERELRKLPREIQRRVLNKVDMLALDPFPPGVEKLAGEKNCWRIRIGDYRAIYKIRSQELIILVLSGAHRKDHRGF